MRYALRVTKRDVTMVTDRQTNKIGYYVYGEGGILAFGASISPFWYQENMSSEEVSEFLAGNRFYSLRCLDFPVSLSGEHEQ